ncbi:MAG: glycosyltransferase family 2 protein [Patescibacteria group bacterium]
METEKSLISIIIPILNEEQNIPLIYKGILGAWKNLESKYDYEIIFVNDGSEDKSGEMIENLSKSNARVKYIEFSRNFGKEVAVSAGLHHSKGGAAIIIDADLQHPPGLIPEFIKKWENGFEAVIGVRKESGKDSIVRNLGAYLFYKIMNSIGETKIVPYSTDYRLLDRKVVIEFNKFTEKNRIIRGLIAWLGFKRGYIYFNAGKRTHGKARYSCYGLAKLAVSSFVSHSLFPLKLAGYFGTFLTLVFGVLGFLVFVNKYIVGDPWGLSVSNNTIFAIIILFSVGIILASLGLMALYIANIHSEVVDRPMYVIRKKSL